MRSTRTRARAPRVRQLTFANRGGKRRGAGRKPKGAQALVSHSTRPALAARFPVLVTLKLERGLPSLRTRATLERLRAAFHAGQERHGLRMVHFSVQSNHIHLLVEARDARSLSRGMQGLAVRIARALNRLWQRKGPVFADRFHSRILRTPREVRYALGYVLNNARKHGARLVGLDPYASGDAFDGWLTLPPRVHHPTGATQPPVVPADTWLLAVGWKRHGRIDVTETPGRAA